MSSAWAGHSHVGRARTDADPLLVEDEDGAPYPDAVQQHFYMAYRDVLFATVTAVEARVREQVARDIEASGKRPNSRVAGVTTTAEAAHIARHGVAS